MYLSEINETPLLNAEEEKELARRIAEGDQEARDQMIRANLRLVVKIARSFTCKGLGLEDLIAEGNVGLLRAVEGFDATLNTRFSTYASYWIKQSIQLAVIKTGKTICVPAYVKQLLVKWRRASDNLREELGRAPIHEEIAARLNLSKKRLAIVRKAIHIYNAVQQPDQGDETASLEETLFDENAKTPEANLLRADDLKQVLGLLEQMHQREAAVLRLRYGLSGEDPKTFEEIGDHFGLTRERVRQIERDALAKLRETMQVD
jgi:RNA polymerase primary sigma factor